jgi:hypothetical protein
MFVDHLGGIAVKRSLLGLIAAVVAVPAFADVSATVAVSEPGFYGQITIGDLRPRLIYAEPVWVARPAKVVYVEPMYLRIPPGHEKHWSKHCGRYNACGRPVYFVREDWYQETYVPYQRAKGGGGQGPGQKGGGKHKPGKGHE